MKRKYVKPEIIFDSFELSQSIAAGCELISQHSQGACPVLDPEIGQTLISEGLCQMTPPGGNDSICYDVPMDSYNVFSS